MASVVAGMINCHECGRLIGEKSHFCQFCGHESPGEESKKEEERELAAKLKPELPIIGGFLIILSSIFLLLTVWLIRDQRGEPFQYWLEGLFSDWPDWFLATLVIFAIIGIIGGLSAIVRKSQAVAIAGGVLASFGIGMVIGIIGLILVAVSEDKFSSSLSDYTERTGDIDSRALERPGYGWRR